MKLKSFSTNGKQSNFSLLLKIKFLLKKIFSILLIQSHIQNIHFIHYYFLVNKKDLTTTTLIQKYFENSNLQETVVTGNNNVNYIVIFSTDVFLHLHFS